PVVRFSLATQNQRSAAFRAGLFSKQKQNRRCVLNRTTKTKPGAQLDATRLHPVDFPEIEDHHAPTASMQKQVGCLQRLFVLLPRLRVSANVLHWGRWIGLAKSRHRSWRPKTTPRKFPVSFDLLSRPKRADVDY